MRRVISPAKKICLIVAVLLIVGMNICAVAVSVRSEIERKPCSDIYVIHIAESLREPLEIRVRDAVTSTLLWMLMPDLVVALLFAGIYKRAQRSRKGEENLIPAVILCTFLIVTAGLMALAIRGYLQRAEAAAASVSRAHAPVIYLYNEDDTPR